VIMMLVLCAAIGVIAVRWPSVFYRLWLVLSLPWAGLCLGLLGRPGDWTFAIGLGLGMPVAVLAGGMALQWVCAPLFPRHIPARSDKALLRNFWRTRT
jgi:hypothetical protein